MFTNSFIERCEKSGINPDFVVDNVSKGNVLIHLYLETGFMSIVAFSDDLVELASVRNSHPRYGSIHHDFIILKNKPTPFLNNLKDCCLINICKNVGELLSVGEYAMLKKSYFKSQAWFDKAKNSAYFGSEIIDNY